MKKSALKKGGGGTASPHKQVKISLPGQQLVEEELTEEKREEIVTNLLERSMNSTERAPSLIKNELLIKQLLKRIQGEDTDPFPNFERLFLKEEVLKEDWPSVQNRPQIEGGIGHFNDMSYEFARGFQKWDPRTVSEGEVFF